MSSTRWSRALLSCIGAVVLAGASRASAVTVLANPGMNCNAYTTTFAGMNIWTPNASGGTDIRTVPEYVVSNSAIVYWPQDDLLPGETVYIMTVFYDRNNAATAVSTLYYQDATQMLRYETAFQQWNPVGNATIVADVTPNNLLGLNPVYAVVYLSSNLTGVTSVFAIDLADGDYYC